MERGCLASDIELGNLAAERRDFVYRGELDEHELVSRDLGQMPASGAVVRVIIMWSRGVLRLGSVVMVMPASGMIPARPV